MPEVPWDDHQAFLEFHRPVLHVMRQLNIEGRLSKEEQLFFTEIKPTEELYDLQNEPEELVNLAEDPAYEGVLEKMRADLKKEEAHTTSKETVYHPQPSTAINILEWVMYKHPEDYLRMLQGEHIGYQKYVNHSTSIRKHKKLSNTGK